MSKKHKISGKRSGPPPLRGPNPNVPPVKLQYGGGADMGKEKGTVTGRPGRDDRAIANRMAQTQQAAINKGKSFQDKSPSPLDTAFKGAKLLGNIATFGVSKALDIPLGAMRVAKNIVDPIAGTVSNKLDSLGINNRKNLNDYAPAKPTFTPLGGDRGLCPDGSNPPCSVVQASDGKSIRVRGTKAAIRGTGFKGVF